MKKRRRGRREAGKLRIGDQWNAISIIAMSQTNPLKAVAEFVENSIDARAREITIVRGKKHGDYYLRICDDGEGVPLDAEGKPDFKFVATHICDSIKRQLKQEGAKGIQGEFGIGLLSFWTLGERLQLMCAGRDGKDYEMIMSKGLPEYRVSQRRLLLPIKGTELVVYPLLPGIRHLNGEKIQRYLASELRDRIRNSPVEVRVVDRTARAEYKVEPREFSGRLLPNLQVPRNDTGEVYLEIYLNEAKPDNGVGLYRRGTRVLPRIADLDVFDTEPWTSGYLQGIIDAPMLNLTPGTRSGFVRDAAFEEFRKALEPLEEQLNRIIEEQRKAEEEKASRQILKSVQRALKEAMLSLPQEEYNWFDVYSGSGTLNRKTRSRPLTVEESGKNYESGPGLDYGGETEDEENPQKEFFHFAGPLYNVLISPKSSMVQVGERKPFRAICRDRSPRQVEENLQYQWEISEGAGRFDDAVGEIIGFVAPDEPGLTMLKLTVEQGDVTCDAEAVVTVTDSIIPEEKDRSGRNKGLPGYTFKRAPGENWRSKYEVDRNLIVVNNGHRDFVHASKNRMRKLRYICRLFGKELVLHNFPGMSAEQLLERMIELSMYTEENLK